MIIITRLRVEAWQKHWHKSITVSHQKHHLKKLLQKITLKCDKIFKKSAEAGIF